MKRMIAVVDDDIELLDSLENLLESAGYVVRKFSSAKTLIDTGLVGIDCLITDIGMPAIDGFELYAFARKTRPELPVFLITGRHEFGDRHHAGAKGVNGFFRKPFDWPALLAAIGSTLHK